MTQRYYQLVMIHIRDRELFDRYQREVAPVAYEHGGAERVLLPDQVMGASVELPDLVNVVYGHSREALDELNADPRFQAVVSMRTDSITMRTTRSRPRPAPDSAFPDHSSWWPTTTSSTPITWTSRLGTPAATLRLSISATGER